MKHDGSKWTSLAALLVFTLFSLCLMLVLLTGAGVYRRLAQSGEAGFTSHTASQYIATRFHQGRNPQVSDFGGCQALVFSEEVGGQTYLTRVYLYDGWLRELYSADTARLAPEDGEKILEVSDIRFDLTDSLLTVQVDGKTSCLTVREGRAFYEE